jgi:nicotinamide mononucleotide transporter
MTSLQGVELFATIFGLLFVILRIRQSLWCWPVGLLYIFPSIYLFYNWRLYSDLILQVIYVFTTFYGWWYWSRGRMALDSDTVPVVSLTDQQQALLILPIGLGTLIVGSLMHHYLGASFPYPDAFVLVASLVAEVLATRKILQNWHLWIFVNITAFILIVMKGGTIYAIIYFVFLVLSFTGLRSWLKER